jgi:hypothetical protein
MQKDEKNNRGVVQDIINKKRDRSLQVMTSDALKIADRPRCVN